MAISFGGFSLKKYKEMLGTDGIIMSGELAYNNVPFVSFFNDGYGGGTVFHDITSKKADNIRSTAIENASKLLDEYGLSSDLHIDPLEIIVSCLANTKEIVRRNKNTYICVIVKTTNKFGFKTNNFGFFSAKNPANLTKSIFKKEEGFVKYVGIIPTFNNHGIFEMANDGKF